MSENIKKAKEQVLYAVKIVCDKNYVHGTAGNISAKVEGEDLFVITPSSYPYDIMTEEDLVVADMEGNIVEGKRKPSIEFSMHRFIYLARSDVKAIVHNHSSYATMAASIEGITSIPAVDIEALVAIGGDLDIAAFAAPGSMDLAENVKKAIGKKGAVLLANHGAIGVGKNMDVALSTCDAVERLALQFINIKAIGNVKPMTEDFVKFAQQLSEKSRGLA